MKRDIIDFVFKCPYYKQVNVEQQKPWGMTTEINIPTWNSKVINMDIILGLLLTRRQYDSIWDLVGILTKYGHFLDMNTTSLGEYYTKLYVNDIVNLDNVP